MVAPVRKGISCHTYIHTNANIPVLEWEVSLVLVAVNEKNCKIILAKDMKIPAFLSICDLLDSYP
jgi:hypothetical protein